MSSRRRFKKQDKKPNQIAAEKLAHRLLPYHDGHDMELCRQLAREASKMEQLHIMNMQLLAALIAYLQFRPSPIPWRQADQVDLSREKVDSYLRRMPDYINLSVQTGKIDMEAVPFDIHASFIRYARMLAFSFQEQLPPPVQEEEEEEYEEGEYEEEEEEEYEEEEEEVF